MKLIPFVVLLLLTSAIEAKTLEELDWVIDQGVGAVAGVATVKVTRGFAYLDKANTDEFLKMSGNPPNGVSYTIAPTDLRWFGILQFDDVGFIKDDEKLDSNDLLDKLKLNTEKGNEYRNKNGYKSLTLEGWASPPNYDKQSQRLEWGTKLRDDQGQITVNMTTKILGRSGFTKVILVTNPNTYQEDWSEFKGYLTNFEYNQGEKYSEWKSGDKVAAYGLGALVLGGAAAAATTKGGIKAIGLAILAGLAVLWAGLKRIFGKK